MQLSDDAIAALADHEAVPQGLPRLMDAWMVVQTQGRIDSANFAVTLTLEPTQHAHPWVVYRREGALLHVGEHRVRLSPHQLQLFRALDGMWAAGDDVAARLSAWPALHAALHASGAARIRVAGELSRVQLQRRASLLPQLFTRVAGRLVPLAMAPNARWAMGRGRRYYLLDA